MYVRAPEFSTAATHITYMYESVYVWIVRRLEFIS